MTVQEIIDGAFGRSSRFVPDGPGQTAQPADLIPAVQQSIDALFQIAARVNPTFFGDTETVAYSSGWARPTDAEAIERIEDPDGEEVIVVPHDQRQAEPGFPCVYRWGRTYFPAGVTPGPETTDALTFFFSRRPTRLSAVGDDIDSAYPESHTALLELDVAIRIALKDGGPSTAVVQPLTAERSDAFRRYVAFLEHETIGERRTHGHVRKFSTNTLVPLTSILAGGGG